MPKKSRGLQACLSALKETQGHKVNYPMIGDPRLKIAKLYGMLPADSGDTSEGRTAAANATVRTVFAIGPDKKIKRMLVYPMTTGRNFDELLRVLDSMQLTARHQVATPRRATDPSRPAWLPYGGTGSREVRIQDKYGRRLQV